MVQAFVLIQAGGRNGLPGRAAVSAIHVVRSADIATGPFDVVARVEATHRCAREARRQEDRGGRGHHLDPDLPRGAALPAARTGRTADPNTRSEASILRISWLRGESEFPRPTRCSSRARSRTLLPAPDSSSRTAASTTSRGFRTAGSYTA